MPDPCALAAAYGVRVELTNLGDWGTANLIAEYDPDGPVIRVDERLVRRQRHAHDDKGESHDERLILRQAQDDRGDGRGPGSVTLSLSKGAPAGVAFERAVGHELYHHREAIGEVPRIANRAAREAAADAYADALVSGR